MIVVEERVNEVIEKMPFDKLYYSWGDLKHLDKWVTQSRGETYPLIYQISKKEEQDTKHRKVSTTWEAVIATQNTNTDLFNNERWALSFRNVLNPIAERLAEGFTKCSFIRWDKMVTIERFGNYGENNEHFTVDIWDAIRFKATIEINDRCQNKIIWQK